LQFQSCIHLGEQSGLRDCPNCLGSVKLKVYACHHPAHTSTTLEDCRFCGDFDQQLEREKVRNWAVGVTTAPRTELTLGRCLASLQSAGWPEFRIFAEPGTVVPAQAGNNPTTWRQDRLGAWPNWFLALGELFLRDPHADAFLVIQDDIVFCRSLRPYLEQSLWPLNRLGFISLYNPLDEPGKSPSWQLLSPKTQLPGALALVFPNFAVRMLLGDSIVLRHRQQDSRAGLAHIDAVISSWSSRHGLGQLVHSPSLVQHIGRTTTLGPPQQDTRLRLSRSFVGESWDAQSWFARGAPSDPQSTAQDQPWNGLTEAIPSI
jgi:hypothetical protein